MGRKEEERGREKGGRGEERQQTVKKQLKLVEYSSTIKNIPKHQPGKVSQRTSMGVDLFVSPIFWYRSFSVSACVCVCMNVHTYIGTCITQNGRGREGRREGGRQGGRETGREGGREGGRQGGREGDREGGKEEDREGGRQGGRETGREGGRETGRKEEEQSAPTLRPCQGRLPLRKYINMCPSASRSSRLLCSGRQYSTSHYGLVSTCQSKQGFLLVRSTHS